MLEKTQGHAGSHVLHYLKTRDRMKLFVNFLEGVEIMLMGAINVHTFVRRAEIEFMVHELFQRAIVGPYIQYFHPGPQKLDQGFSEVSNHRELKDGQIELVLNKVFCFVYECPIYIHKHGAFSGDIL